MCRLFGLVANKEVDVEFSFLKADKSMKYLSKAHPDGWGIGWYENSKPKAFKQGRDDGLHYDFDRVKKVRSHIIIGHVRRATEGDKSRKNAHPFCYKQWLFAHNGSVDRSSLLQLLNDEFKQDMKSKTDSEVYFRLILQWINEADDIFEGIRRGIANIKQRIRHTGLNFVLSDGKALYAYRDASENHNYYSLYYLERNPEITQGLDLLSAETRELIRSKKLAGERAVVIASEKMTGEDWIEIAIGQLVRLNRDLRIEKVKIE